MAKLPGIDEGMLTSSTALRDVVAAAAAAGDVNMDSDDGGAAAAAAAASTEVSLEEILTLYNQPINEEQAWAVCYQCCRTLAQKQRRKGLKSAGASAGDHLRRIEGPGDVMIWRDGTVKLHSGGGTGKRGDRARCWDSPRQRVSGRQRGCFPHRAVRDGSFCPLALTHRPSYGASLTQRPYCCVSLL